MVARLRLLGLALAGVALPLAAQPTAHFEAVSTSEIDKATQTDDVAIQQDRYERMTVPVHIGGAGPYQFLVDTGADRTAISRQMAQQLGLTRGPAARLHSITGASNVNLATIPVLRLSEKEVREIEAPLLDANHMGADGILGVDSLRSQRVLFDFKAGKLSIVPSRTRPVEEEEEGAIVVRGKLKNGRLILTDAKAEDQRVRVVLDTGAQYSMGNRALQRALLRRGILRTEGRMELTSVTGQKMVGDIGRLEELEMGGVTMKGLIIVFTDAPIFRKLSLEKRPAVLLGMNGLRGFDKISIDFASKKLRVILPEESSLMTRFAAR